MFTRCVAIILLTLPWSYGCQDAKKQESRALLELVHAINIKDPYPKRKAALAALQRVEIRDNGVARVRELCVKAHKALIESEERQSQARLTLGGSVSGNPKSPFPADKANEVTTMIEQSNTALRLAITTFPLCEREIRSLAIRFSR
jgi:hypothetical protein